MNSREFAQRPGQEKIGFSAKTPLRLQTVINVRSFHYRLNSKQKRFVKENDWEYWQKIDGIIKNNESEKIKNHLSAIVHRLCNIYEEWYETLDLGNLFFFEPENIS